MKLRINGEFVTVPSRITTITDLIEHFEINNRVVIVEHNDTILEKQDHSGAKVSDGDIIELVQFVGGG
jgi:sulfur carrier protein